MDFHAWRSKAERLLSELKAIDFGYPLGENVIHEPASDNSLVNLREDAALPEELQDFYGACDGLSWPQGRRT